MPKVKLVQVRAYELPWTHDYFLKAAEDTICFKEWIIPKEAYEAIVQAVTREAKLHTYDFIKKNAIKDKLDPVSEERFSSYLDYLKNKFEDTGVEQ